MEMHGTRLVLSAMKRSEVVVDQRISQSVEKPNEIKE